MLRLRRLIVSGSGLRFHFLNAGYARLIVSDFSLGSTSSTRATPA